MRKQNWSGITAALVLAAAVGVAAQEPSPPQNSPQPPPQPPAAEAPATAAPQSAQSPESPQSNDARKITVAGCLQAAPSGPVGTSGSAAPAPATSPAPEAAAKPEGGSGNVKLVLANAVASPAEGAANASNSAPQTYRLIANEAALMPHVGKKLELTGTVVEDQNSPARPATSQSNDSSAANGPQLRVEAGKVVAATCTP